MARPVPTPRLLGAKGFLDVIFDRIPNIIIRGGSAATDVPRIPVPHWPPDKVQGICREQESGARVIIWAVKKDGRECVAHSLINPSQSNQMFSTLDYRVHAH
jgi:hypothetical protein